MKYGLPTITTTITTSAILTLLYFVEVDMRKPTDKVKR
jgi:hypothetical protein